jgi:hypothetical protein
VTVVREHRTGLLEDRVTLPDLNPILVKNEAGRCVRKLLSGQFNVRIVKWLTGNRCQSFHNLIFIGCLKKEHVSPPLGSSALGEMRPSGRQRNIAVRLPGRHVEFSRRAPLHVSHDLADMGHIQHVVAITKKTIAGVIDN